MKMKRHPKKRMLVRQRRGLLVTINLRKGYIIMFLINGLCSHHPFFQMLQTVKRKLRECRSLVSLPMFRTLLKDLLITVRNFDGFPFMAAAWAAIGAMCALLAMWLLAQSLFYILSMLI